MSDGTQSEIISLLKSIETKTVAAPSDPDVSTVKSNTSVNDIIAAPGSGKRVVLTGFIVENSNSSTSRQITVSEAQAGVPIFIVSLLAKSTWGYTWTPPYTLAENAEVNVIVTSSSGTYALFYYIETL